MMSPCSTMGEEMQFHQRWEFRRADDDCDSSSNDTKRSSEPVLKKHKLVANLISLNDEESSGTSRLQQQGDENPEVEAEITSEKPKTRQTRKRGGNLRNAGRKNDSREEADRTNRGKRASARDLTPLEDLRNFMGSLIEDLTVAREKLSKWMKEEVQKLVDDDDTASQPKRRRRSCKVEKVQERKKPERKTKGQLQQRKKPEKSIQEEQHSNLEEPAYVPQVNDFQNDVEVLPRKRDEVINLETNERSLERSNQANNESDFINYYRALEDGAQHSQAKKPRASTEKENSEKQFSSMKSIIQTSPTNQTVQGQSQKSVVLAIEAQNCNGGSVERTVKGKKAVDSRNHYQALENQVANGQATGAATSGEKTNREKPGLPMEPNFLSSSQVPSSMYIPLPPAFTEPGLTNHRLNASSGNYILSRVTENNTTVHTERMSQLIDPSGNSGYFPGKQPEERIRGFAHMSSGIGCFNQNTMPTSSIGAGFPFPLHHGLDASLSIPNQVNMELLSRENISTLGLRMNGGAIRFPGANYNNPPEHYIANNQHNQSRTDGRFLSYQIPNIRDGNFS